MPEKQNSAGVAEKMEATATAAVPWTPAEQQLLEQALKTYPASVADRWDQISACIPSRTKKECMKRYKVSVIAQSIEQKVLRSTSASIHIIIIAGIG